MANQDGSSIAPEDKLWIELLLRDEDAGALTDAQVRDTLREWGFPGPIIDGYLTARVVHDEKA